MSSVARKTGNRTVTHRSQNSLIAANSIALLDEDRSMADPREVFLAVTDVDVFLDRMDRCIEEAKLNKLDHAFIDGGALIRFRSKQDADVFRQVMAE